MKNLDLLIACFISLVSLFLTGLLVMYGWNNIIAVAFSMDTIVFMCALGIGVFIGVFQIASSTDLKHRYLSCHDKEKEDEEFLSSRTALIEVFVKIIYLIELIIISQFI